MKPTGRKLALTGTCVLNELDVENVMADVYQTTHGWVAVVNAHTRVPIDDLWAAYNDFSEWPVVNGWRYEYHE